LTEVIPVESVIFPLSFHMDLILSGGFSAIVNALGCVSAKVFARITADISLRHLRGGIFPASFVSYGKNFL
jgi:hypothetical protein